MRAIPLSAALVAVLACNGKTPADSTCSSNNDCRAGEVCVGNHCATLCSMASHCQDGECCTDGVCQTCDVGDPPVITTVNGTGSIDGATDHTERRMRDRVVVTGANLSGAVATLIGTNPARDPVALIQCAPGSDSELQLGLPTTLEEGDYILRVANQAGECNASLKILQGEPGSLDASATEIIDSVNAALTADSGLAMVRSGDLSCTDCLDGSEIADGAIVGSHLSVPMMVGPLTIWQSNVGVGSTQPVGVFEVSNGYTYTFAGNVGGTPTPACDCDVSPTAYDCGSANFDSTFFQGADCYDTGTGGNDHYQSTDAPDLVVASDGNVGIGTTTPATKLEVAGHITATRFVGPATQLWMGDGRIYHAVVAEAFCAARAVDAGYSTGEWGMIWKDDHSLSATCNENTCATNCVHAGWTAAFAGIEWINDDSQYAPDPAATTFANVKWRLGTGMCNPRFCCCRE